MTTQTVPTDASPANGAELRPSGTLSFATLEALIASGVAVDDVAGRLVELGRLEDGWFDGEGYALDREGLAWFNACMHAYYLGRGLPDLHLRASVSGGVSAELSLERFECGLEVDLVSHEATWFDADIEVDEEVSEQTLNLDDPSAWQWLAGRVRSFTKRA